MSKDLEELRDFKIKIRDRKYGDWETLAYNLLLKLIPFLEDFEKRLKKVESELMSKDIEESIKKNKRKKKIIDRMSFL